jgi:hypothetical protein
MAMDDGHELVYFNPSLDELTSNGLVGAIDHDGHGQWP